MTLDEALIDLKGRPAFAVFLKSLHQAREQAIGCLGPMDIPNDSARHVLGSIAAYDEILKSCNYEEVIKSWERLTG